MSVAQRIVDALSDPLLVVDETLAVREANAALFDTFAVAPSAVPGRSLFAIGGGVFSTPALEGPLRALAAQDRPGAEVEFAAATPASDDRRFRLKGRPLPGEPEAARRFLIVIRDITEQRRLEAKLRHHSARLQRSNRDLEEFARVASHDLQEPVRMVSNYLQLLERRYKAQLPDQAREFIDFAVDGAERMKALINGLLQYSRVGRKEGAFREVALDTLLDKVLDDLSRRIDETGATVTRDPLPATNGNPEQLRRVVQNVVENALTYAGDAPRIHVSGRAEGAGVHLVIQDDGPGIPADAQDRVFKLFKQLDPHGLGKQGAGMGLALCKRIAERHGGRMWVESAPGDGAAVHVTLQLTPEAA